jgi:hypothetical protein
LSRPQWAKEKLQLHCASSTQMALELQKIYKNGLCIRG